MPEFVSNGGVWTPKVPEAPKVEKVEVKVEKVEVKKVVKKPITKSKPKKKGR